MAEVAEEAAHSRVLAGVVYPSDARAGLELGRAVAARVIAYLQLDETTYADTVPVGPGLWQGKDPIGVNELRRWKPLVLASASQFRPGPPPAPDSPERAAEIAGHERQGPLLAVRAVRGARPALPVERRGRPPTGRSRARTHCAVSRARVRAGLRRALRGLDCVARCEVPLLDDAPHPVRSEPDDRASDPELPDLRVERGDPRHGPRTRARPSVSTRGPPLPGLGTGVRSVTTLGGDPLPERPGGGLGDRPPRRRRHSGGHRIRTVSAALDPQARATSSVGSFQSRDGGYFSAGYHNTDRHSPRAWTHRGKDPDFRVFTVSLPRPAPLTPYASKNSRCSRASTGSAPTPAAAARTLSRSSATRSVVRRHLVLAHSSHVRAHEYRHHRRQPEELVVDKSPISRNPMVSRPHRCRPRIITWLRSSRSYRVITISSLSSWSMRSAIGTSRCLSKEGHSRRAGVDTQGTGAGVIGAPAGEEVALSP